MSTASTEDSTIASDEVSYESVSGRLTPTMASPVERPSVVVHDAATSSSSNVSARSNANNSNSGKGCKKISRKQQHQQQAVPRRGKKASVGSEVGTSVVGQPNRVGGTGGVRNHLQPSQSASALPPPPTPRRLASLKPSNGSATNRSARQQRVSKLSQNGQQQRASNHQSSNRRSVSDAGPDHTTMKQKYQSPEHPSVDVQHAVAPRGVTTPTPPFDSPTRYENASSTPLGSPLPLRPPPGLQPCLPSRQRAVTAGEMPVHSTFRSVSGDIPRGTPVSTVSAPTDQQGGSFFSSSWTNQPPKPSWVADPSSSSLNAASFGFGETTVDRGCSLSVGAPPGLTSPTCSLNSGSGHSFDLSQPHRASIDSLSSRGDGEVSPFIRGLSLPAGSSPRFGSAATMPLNRPVKGNPFVVEEHLQHNDSSDVDQIEAELQELGGQMVGSILDF